MPWKELLLEKPEHTEMSGLCGVETPRTLQLFPHPEQGWPRSGCFCHALSLTAAVLQGKQRLPLLLSWSLQLPHSWKTFSVPVKV